jgi:hypothetical protein
MRFICARQLDYDANQGQNLGIVWYGGLSSPAHCDQSPTLLLNTYEKSLTTGPTSRGYDDND